MSENTPETYQGTKKASLWKVSISDKSGLTSSEGLAVLADSKVEAKKDVRVLAEMTRMGLTSKTAKIVIEEVCPVL